MNWLQAQARNKIQAFREHQGMPLLPLTQEEMEAGSADKHLEGLRTMFAEIANAPPSPPRVVQPMLKGDVEEAAAGMAALNGLDFEHGMTESERQPYREEAANMIIQARKDRELARQAELEKSGAFDGLDGH